MKRDSRVGPVSLCNVEVVCVRGGQVQPSLASPMTTGGAAEQGEAWHTTVCVLRIPDDTVEVVRVRGGQAQPSSASPMIAGARWSEARRGKLLCAFFVVCIRAQFGAVWVLGGQAQPSSASPMRAGVRWSKARRGRLSCASSSCQFPLSRGHYWCSGEDHSVWCRGSTLAGPPALRTPKHTRSLAHLPTAHRPASPRALPRPPPSIPATTLTPTPTAHRPSPAARHPATRPPGHPATRPPAAAPPP